MGDRTGIQWTNATWNPLRGCSRVSAGCQNCYAETMAGRFCGPGQPYEGLITLGSKGPRWNGSIMEVPHKLGEPLRWTKPRMVFVNSMSDLFHENVSNDYIARVFAVMHLAQRHTFQVLTKRPQRMLEWFAWLETDEGRASWLKAIVGVEGGPAEDWSTAWPFRNVWLGVSVEDQQTADARVPLLLKCPVAMRWVSYEPALGPVDFNATPAPPGWMPLNGATMDDLRGSLSRWQEAPLQECELFRGMDWIVVGGESGAGARPFELAWARDVVRQCVDARTPVFVKQLGSCVPGIELKARKGDDMDEWPSDLRIRQWPESVHG